MVKAACRAGADAGSTPGSGRPPGKETAARSSILYGESYGQSLSVYKESDMPEQLTLIIPHM